MPTEATQCAIDGQSAGWHHSAQPAVAEQACDVRTSRTVPAGVVHGAVHGAAPCAAADGRGGTLLIMMSLTCYFLSDCTDLTHSLFGVDTDGLIVRVGRLAGESGTTLRRWTQS